MMTRNLMSFREATAAPSTLATVLTDVNDREMVTLTSSSRGGAGAPFQTEALSLQPIGYLCLIRQTSTLTLKSWTISV